MFTSETKKEDLVRIPRAQDSDEASMNSSRPFGIQRMTLTLALSCASVTLAVGSIFISLYIYKSGLQALQRAETEVQQKTIPKLTKETVTAEAEATYASELNRLRTVNEGLQSELIKSQSAQALADAARAEAEAARARIEAELKEISLRFAKGTTGSPEFIAATTRAWGYYITPVVDCLVKKPTESQSEFEKRCVGKDFASRFKELSSPASVAPSRSLAPEITMNACKE
jgi:hypothetical protein